MKSSTYCLLSTLLVASFFSSCSRPTAFVQRTPSDHLSATHHPSVRAVSADDASTSAPALAMPAATDQSVAQTTAAVEQLEASINEASAATTDKKVQKRLNRVRTILAAASAKATPASFETSAPHKANLVERMMLKRIDKKISKQLAPQKAEKAMINSGTLATGAVFVLIGLLLLLLTTGTAATIGLIAIIVGAVLLLVGLL